MKRLICATLLILTQLVQANLFRRVEEFEMTVPYACRTPGYESNDIDLISRIITSYQLAKKEHLGNSMWQVFFDQRHKPIHEAFVRGNFNICADILRNPKDSDLFYGIDNLCASVLPAMINQGSLVGLSHMSLDLLVRFGEAISAIRLDNPESYADPRSNRKWNSSDVLNRIENKLGMQIFFPNPYAEEIGIWTPRGVVSVRAAYALYQAYLIKEHVKGIENPRVLEIGAGVGRTAYYARAFGIKDYTIIDIPMTNITQAYFLGKVLGDDQVALLGEHQTQDKIKILTPDQFLNDAKQYYDLIINVDSLTEMNATTMQAYITKISQSTPIFISINHEVNTHTVNDFAMKCNNLKFCQRMPHWMRTGYVEEIYNFE